MSTVNNTRVVGRALLFFILCIAVLIVTGSITKPLSFVTATFFVGAVSSALTFMLTWTFTRWDGGPLAEVGAAITSRSPLRFFTGFVIGMAVLATQVAFLLVDGHVRWVVGPRLPFGTVVIALCGFVLLAFREELAFRGYLFFRLNSVWGMLPAFLCMILIFGLEHFAAGWTPGRALGTIGGAVLFGVAAFATRGLAVPIGLHAAFNFGQWALGLKEAPGILQPLVDVGYAPHTEAIGYGGYFTGMFLTAGGLWFLWKPHSQRFAAGADTTLSS
jgi:membrane protease YdiL (CAAX protease family)